MHDKSQVDISIGLPFLLFGICLVYILSPLVKDGGVCYFPLREEMNLGANFLASILISILLLEFRVSACVGAKIV